ncbi:hypothetical protein AGMMS49938_18780 [Fibrobacterales bacterium]|nr:hypothetical protein AGMMS49938_18780 [Fibrobacterales bacterium]
MGAGQRIGAGLGAAMAGVAGPFAPLHNENDYSNFAQVPDTPAVYQEYTPPEESQPSPTQELAEIGATNEEFGNPLDENLQQDENIEQANASKDSGYADHTDSPSPEQTVTNEPKTNEGENNNSDPSEDNGYDYSGYGY